MLTSNPRKLKILQRIFANPAAVQPLARVRAGGYPNLISQNGTQLRSPQHAGDFHSVKITPLIAQRRDASPGAEGVSRRRSDPAHSSGCRECDGNERSAPRYQTARKPRA